MSVFLQVELWQSWNQRYIGDKDKIPDSGAQRYTQRLPQDECSPSYSLALGHLAYAVQLAKVGTVAP